MATSGVNHTVFMSYSWDSEEHKEWVLRLAEALQREPDIEVSFDGFDTWAGKDLTHFMERGLECERVVIVITPNYVERSRGRVGGAGYETSLITADLMKDMRQDTFIPVLRAGDDVPPFLGTKFRIDFRDESRLDESLMKLVAAIRRQPEARRPEKLGAGDVPIHRAVEVRVRATDPKVRHLTPPLMVLEGRFGHLGTQRRREGMYVHNVGDETALDVHIEPLGHEPKWMIFGKIAVVRPNSDPAEIPITFEDADDVFAVGAYISMVSTLRGAAQTADEAAHDDHPLRFTYRDRTGNEYVNEEYVLRFHESKPFVAANAYYEVARRIKKL